MEGHDDARAPPTRTRLESSAPDASVAPASGSRSLRARPDAHAAARFAVRGLEFGDRVVVVIDMESGQRFIIRCEAAIPLPALVHVLS